ncbi:NAD-dependent succinate-semialdehyde dehydrogenase [Ferrimonas futtsuensis]|uniref:NAD-dependent succinate-semialdehyde dehydrogenase n=1 Tax=Ferrimonas futtsuensis TaxID=364764 RepID=UPI00040DD92C|nr:NAD-dependent succinate-semialdehyde dehydrogenase [Ferrimonas futtsuensis]
MTKLHKAYIGGQWLTGNRGSFEVDDPATGESVAKVADVSLDQVEQAIDAANQAFESWRRLSAQERADGVLAWYDKVRENRQRLAEMITRESGKPIAEALSEVDYGASYLRWFAEQGVRAGGQTLPTLPGGRRPLTLKQPVGVVGVITPWNFPLAMIARKAAPALAAGCTLVIKPAAETPLTALLLAELAEQAGLPAGVINLIPGTDAAAIGKCLCTHSKVRKLSFTGSTAVGRVLMAQSAQKIQRLSLELGGNAPFLVFDDANLEAAVEGLIASKFRNSGQTCVCANRILVQRGIYDSFIARLKTRMASLTLGPGALPGADLGPLISDRAIARVESLVEQALEAGAVQTLGAGRVGEGSRYHSPTLLESVTPENPIWSQEIFGPVVSVTPFDSEEDGITLANHTEAGLASYLFSDSLSRAIRVAESLDYGMVGINEGIISSATAPFGGIKSSGLGREGGQEGMDEYLETKYLCLGGIG